MFSLFSISGAKELVPLALVALIGAGAWYLWQRGQAAQTQASENANFTGSGQSAAINLAVLSALFGGSPTGAQVPGDGRVSVTAGGAPNAPGFGAPVSGNNGSVVPSTVTQGL